MTGWEIAENGDGRPNVNTDSSVDMLIANQLLTQTNQSSVEAKLLLIENRLA
jgi:hypothetical protein